MQQEAGIPFLNVFNRGMHRDSYPTQQPEGTYIEMRNCVLTSVNGNNLVVRDCMGNAVVVTVNTPYDGTVAAGLQVPGQPIAFISFPGTLIVLSTNDDTEDGGYGEIGRISVLPYGEGIQPNAVTGQANSGYTPLYHHADLNFTRRKRVEGFAYPENDQQQNIYWTDNLNNPRVFNTADTVYTTYIASGSLSATAGVKYMVLEGAVEYPVASGTFYGPGLTATNILTTNGVNTTYTATTGTAPTPKIIEYIPYERLSWQPDRAIATLKHRGFGSGNKYCGSKVYYTRYGNNDGYRTPWGYGAAPILVPRQNDYLVSNDYHDTVGAGTTTLLVNSHQSVQLTVENIDTRYDVIEVACAEYDNLAEVPRSIGIVISETITGASMDLEDLGNLNGILTIDQISLFPASILKFKTIATSKNFMLGGNPTLREELDITNATYPGTVTISALQYPMPVYSDPQACANLMQFDPVVPVAGANPAATTIVPNSRYLVTSVAGGSITYNAVVYGLGSVFTGVAGSPSATIPAGSQCRPCVTLNKYNNQQTGKRVENAIELTGAKNTFWDYKSASVASMITGYRGNEKYRWAIVYEDLKGNPYYARWLGDYTMPTITSKGGLMTKATFSGADFYSLNPSIIKISGLSIPVAMAANIGGFRIVRAVCDPRIITQGLVAQCAYEAGPIYRPTAWAFPEGDANPCAGPDSASESYYTFISPDHLVNFINPTGENGDTLEMAAWLDAVGYAGGTYTKSKNNGQSCQSTFIGPLTADTNLQSSDILVWRSFNEGEGANNFDGGGNGWQNTMHTDLVTANTNDLCCGGGGLTNLNDRDAQGGRKCVFKRTDNILQYNSVNAYNSTLEVGNPKKILMNYCKPNTTQYGGTSNDALAATYYISTGHYQPLTAAVKAATLVGQNYVFDDIEIGGGDTFVSLVDYGYGLWDDSLAVGSAHFSQGWYFPCESRVNYGLRRGRKTSNVELYYDDGVSPGTKPNPQAVAYFITGNGTRLEGLSYNQGYSTVGEAIKYAPLPVNFINASQFPSTIYFAGPKISGELTDSFRTFLVNDFHNLDGQGGDINKIAIKDGYVIVWQNKMMQTVPILQRQIFSGTDGQETSVGTGGVVDRNDPITSHFGTQHQWSVTETDNGFVWFDMRHKEFMNFETGVGKLSTGLGMKSFFDEIFLEAKGTGVDTTKLLNSPTWAETSDRPLVGVGIHGGYDPKFHMVFMTFKFKYHYKNGADFNYLDKDFTIGYDAVNKYFIGFFDFWPGIFHTHNNTLLSVNSPSNPTKYFGPNMPSTAFVIGDEIASVSGTCICISPVTIASYPASPEVDTAHWQLISKTSQVWAHNQPTTLAQTTAPDYIYSSFFGRAVNSLLKFVINPQVAEDFYVGNAEQSTPTNVNYTDISITNEAGTATDATIRSTDPNYRFKFSKIAHSLPLSTTGNKLIGKYLTATFTKKNWTADPRTVDKAVKVLESVKSFFTIKR